MAEGEINKPDTAPRAATKDTPATPGSRRDFLLGAAVASAGVVAACSRAANTKEKGGKVAGGGSDFDVIVIGGGMAGSAAARECARSGLRTVLLEARNRLGGRTFYAPFGDHKIELGANYVHWTQPHIWAEIDRYRLPIDDTPSAIAPERWIYLKNGKPVEADINKMSAKLNLALEEFCSKSAEIFPRGYEPHATDNWKPYQNMSLQDRIDEMKLDEDTRLLTNAIWSLSVGAPAKDASFLEMLRWWAALGNCTGATYNEAISRWRLKNGTISLIRAMLDDCNAEVRLSTPVSKITQNGTGVKVTVEGGQTLTARKVILSTPLNTWGDITYEPAISEVKLRTSKERHVGASNKMHVKTKKPIGNIFLTADDSFSALQYMYTESATPTSTTLLGYGWDGKFDVNNLETVQTMLRNFIPDIELEATYGYQWLFDPFSKGTWCTLRPHQFKHVPELQRAEGNIHFATADNASMWRGWMDGGIEMGNREGKAVAKALVA